MTEEERLRIRVSWVSLIRVREKHVYARGTLRLPSGTKILKVVGALFRTEFSSLQIVYMSPRGEKKVPDFREYHFAVYFQGASLLLDEYVDTVITTEHKEPVFVGCRILP